MTAAATPSIRLPQARILKALAAAKGPMTRREIVARISKDPERPTAIGDALGVTDRKNRPAREKAAGFHSLLTLGFVTAVADPTDENGTAVHSITAAGRRALAAFGRFPAQATSTGSGALVSPERVCTPLGPSERFPAGRIDLGRHRTAS